MSFVAAIVSCSEGLLDGGNDSVNDSGSSAVGQESVHGPISMQLSSVTATTAVFAGSLDMTTAMLYTELGIIYSTDPALSQNNGTKVRITELINNEHFMEDLLGLPHSSEIYYAPYYCTAAGLFVIGEVKSFKTIEVSMEVSVEESSITEHHADLIGEVRGISDVDKSCLEIGVYCVSEYDKAGIEIRVSDIQSNGSFSVSISGLSHGTKYNYFCYIRQKGNDDFQGELKEFTTVNYYTSAIKEIDMSYASDLSSFGTSNCYVISNGGTYKFKTVRGNGNISVGNVASCSIVWESYCSGNLQCCAMISHVFYKDGYIAFQTADPFVEGNALLAAKDASGNVLWTWHIWLTSSTPKGQQYYNNAGIMMDCNLGATSLDGFGLLYQWGRKDPFLRYESESTIRWPQHVESTASTGTIDWTLAHPTTFINGNNHNWDWYYTGSKNTDNTRWQKSKTIYDPCPSGWKVPSGGPDGVWAKARGGEKADVHVGVVMGVNLADILGNGRIWYWMPGYISGNAGFVEGGDVGRYWSSTPYDKNPSYEYSVYGLGVYDIGYINFVDAQNREYGHSVRCQKE